MGKHVDPKKYADAIATLPEGATKASFDSVLTSRGYDVPKERQGFPRFPSIPIMTPGGMMMSPDRDAVANALPTIGAMAGGAGGAVAGALTTPVTGPVGAPAGDVIGSAGGAYLGDMGRRAMLGMPQDAAASGRTAAINGGLALGGNLAAPLVRGAGNMLVRQGYRIAPGLAEKFPSIFKDVEQARIPVGGRTSRGGTARASEMMGEARRMKGAAIAADASTHPAESLAQDAVKQAAAAKGSPLDPQEAAALVAKVKARADELLGEATHGVVQRPPGDYAAREVDQIRMRAQSANKPGYAASQRGDWKPPSELDAPLASRARDIQRGNPTLDEAITGTKKAIGLRKAVGRAELRPEPDLRASLYPALAGSAAGHFMGGGPGSIEGGTAAVLIQRMLADPRIASRVGFALNSPATVGATRVVPRLAGPFLNGGDAQNTDQDLLDYLNSSR